ncbi:protein FAM220A isoform X1 [Mustela putorius furo]|uniref:Protein FAM220A isoform X1 n=1 Tax=Mustela putorius furo TaxID=9669 RepID=A0A8U0NCK1_MUSPF|nr:protein FAM220A isoform X1 [Mustela putorius furo]XP_044931061.1 protein FAM220A isoform X1 [Mustela putorius furo]
MRDTCLGKVQAAGEDSDRLLYGLEGAQGESPCPTDTPSPSGMPRPAVDGDGNSQSEELSVEMKNASSEASLFLHNGNKTLPCLKESLRRNSASVAGQSKTVHVFCAPAGERSAGVCCGAREALLGRGLEGGPGATNRHGGRGRTAESQASGLPRPQKRSESGISEEEPPSALLEGLGFELELSGLHFVLSPLLHAHPEVFLNETQSVFLGHSEPLFSEPTVESKKMLSSVRSTSDDLQIILGLLALPAFEIANSIRHS